MSLLSLLDRIEKSKLPIALARSLFLGLFSFFDAFKGKLLFDIFKRKPSMLKAFDKNVSLREVLSVGNFKSLRNYLITDVIQDLGRDSYVDQFKKLESWFGLELRKFNHWADFVECGQRRNLITHCDGKVNKQYLTLCRENDYKFKKDLKEGKTLPLDHDYFLNSCELIMEVGFKLGQTLWRKVFPEELNTADHHLTNISYEFLRLKKWTLTEITCEYLLSLKHDMKDVDKKIGLVNYAIALKKMGDKERLNEIIEKIDWSGAALAFRLAVSVIKEDYKEAAQFMRKIGKESELVQEESYHIWPLFDDFRGSMEFLEAYEEIYGYPFIKEQQKKADKKEEELKKKIVSLKGKEKIKKKELKELLNIILSLLPDKQTL